MIDSFSFGESCDVWEFDYFCWEFSGPGRVWGKFESAYTIFFGIMWPKIYSNSFSDSFTGINPENCLTLIRVFYNYFLTDNPDLHAVLGLALTDRPSWPALHAGLLVNYKLKCSQVIVIILLLSTNTPKIIQLSYPQSQLTCSLPINILLIYVCTSVK
jgi:hypothetical protein